MTRNRPPLGAVCAVALLAGLQPAAAQFHAEVGAGTNLVLRGLTQSDDEPYATAAVRYQLPAGVHVSLSAATVGTRRFAGGAGLKLTPEVGGQWPLGADWTVGAQLTSQVFPGASGRFDGRLSTRAGGRPADATAVRTDYATTEAGAWMSWRGHLTLTTTRTLGDYYGIRGTVDGRELGSAGTRYLALDAWWPFTPAWSASAGVGRLHVAGFSGLDAADWRLGLQARADPWRFSAVVSGTNADRDGWRLRSDRRESRLNLSVTRGW